MDSPLGDAVVHLFASLLSRGGISHSFSEHARVPQGFLLRWSSTGPSESIGSQEHEAGVCVLDVKSSEEILYSKQTSHNAF